MIESVFHAEVCHRSTLAVGFHVHVLTEVGIHFVHAGNEFCVLRKFCQTFVAQTAEQFHGILIHLTEQIFVQTAEKLNAFHIPGPPKVVGHFVKFLQGSRDVALD